MYQKVAQDRISGVRDLVPLFSLGDLYLSNFVDPADVGKDHPKAPLSIMFSPSSQCVQLEHTVDRGALYDEYWYVSGINKTVTNDLKSIVRYCESICPVGPKDIVLDIACNDGTLLKQYKKGPTTVGVDPAKNIPCEGVDVFINELFTSEGYFRLMGHPAKIITAAAVLYHFDDPVSSLTDIYQCLDDEGVFVAQVSYLPSLLEANAIDSIGHEHIAQFSLHSLFQLFERVGFKIVDAVVGTMNCGTLRVTAMKPPSVDVEKWEFGLARVQGLLEFERNIGINDYNTYYAFFDRVEIQKRRLLSLLKSIRDRDQRVFVYGASTKGNILLQYYGIDNNLAQKAVERNPMKVGKVCVGSNIPIISEEEMRGDPPDYLLVLPWHFKDEFLEREQEYLANGGKFIFPLPEVEVVGK